MLVVKAPSDISEPAEMVTEENIPSIASEAATGAVTHQLLLQMLQMTLWRIMSTFCEFRSRLMIFESMDFVAELFLKRGLHLLLMCLLQLPLGQQTVQRVMEFATP